MKIQDAHFKRKYSKPIQSKIKSEILHHERKGKTMKISDIIANLESCIIAFEEGASDEKHMSLLMLEQMIDDFEVYSYSGGRRKELL